MNFEREQKLALAVPGYVEYIFNISINIMVDKSLGN